MKWTGGYLLDQLQDMGPCALPTDDGRPLVGIAVEKDDQGRGLLVFGYEGGARHALPIEPSDHGIVAYVKDSVVVAFARTTADMATELGIDLSSKQSMHGVGIEVVEGIEDMLPEDMALCVGPIVDVAVLDQKRRWKGVVPSLPGSGLTRRMLAGMPHWTPAARSDRPAQAQAQAAAGRDSEYVPAWGVKAAAHATSATPRGRALLGRR